MNRRGSALDDDIPLGPPRWSEFVDAYGKIDFDGFASLVRDVACLHYPRLRLEPQEALRSVRLPFPPPPTAHGLVEDGGCLLSIVALDAQLLYPALSGLVCGLPYSGTWWCVVCVCS
jgi:hypothetical protein